jgi:hypothetical protein
MQDTFFLDFAAAAEDTTLVSPLAAVLNDAVDEMRRLYGCRDEILIMVDGVQSGLGLRSAFQKMMRDLDPKEPATVV